MLSAWDAATTAYGFTYGGAFRLDFRNSQFNFAAVTVDKEAGGTKADWAVDKNYSLNLQYVQRFTLGSTAGSIRGLGFYNKSFCGAYDSFDVDTASQTAYFPDEVKANRAKYGFGLDMDLAFNENHGIFARYSWNDGNTESMGYTQADRAFNMGWVYSFGRIKRPNDALGICGSINELSERHQRFLEAGGTGFMLGDGSLDYDREMVAEVFYKINLIKNADITMDYQYVMNSAYNKSRGNVHFLGLRLDFSF